jgi:hypothetical protein
VSPHSFSRRVSASTSPGSFLTFGLPREFAYREFEWAARNFPRLPITVAGPWPIFAAFRFPVPVQLSFASVCPARSRVNLGPLRVMLVPNLRIDHAVGSLWRTNLTKRASAVRPNTYHQRVPAAKTQITASVENRHPRKYAGSEMGRSANRMNVNSIPTCWSLGSTRPT